MPHAQTGGSRVFIAIERHGWVLARLCATPSAEDPSPGKRLNILRAEPSEIERAIFVRDNWLSEKQAPKSRCNEEPPQ